MNPKNRARHQLLRRLHRPHRDHAAALHSAHDRFIATTRAAESPLAATGIGHALMTLLMARIACAPAQDEHHA